MTPSADGPTLCPSAPAAPGAALIGMVGEDSRVANLGRPLPVDAGFLNAARANGPPERRFRFSSPCVDAHCAQWNGRACGLIDLVVGHVMAAGALQVRESLPRCAIRAGCRWWRQRGAAACAVCPLIVTDAGGSEDAAAVSTAATVPAQPSSSSRALASCRSGVSKPSVNQP
jgi:hypothetical protein